jgi:hypothetical protein
VLVLLSGVIFRYTVNVAVGGMIYMPSFIKIGIGAQAILRFDLSNLKDCNVGITARKDM